MAVGIIIITSIIWTSVQYKTVGVRIKEVGCVSLKADLDSTIFAYDYRARLAFVMIFDHPHAHNFHLRYPQCVVRMSWV